MNRKYTAKEYAKGVELVRKYFKNPAIATDIMVGFPGETEDEFNESLDFAVSVAFADAHVFAYSNRKGTKADLFPNQVPKAEKEKRSKLLISALKKTQKEYLKSQLGKTARVLFEQSVGEGMYEGHMTNYVKVRMKSDTDLSGSFADVKLAKIEKDYIIAELFMLK